MKKSILISGSDYEYSNSMAAHLAEEDRDMYVVAVTEKQFYRQRKNLMDSFDLFLLDENMRNECEEILPRTVFMSGDMQIKKGLQGDNTVFKYQSIKNISEAIQKCMHGNGMIENIRHDEKHEDGDPWKSESAAVVIGVTGSQAEKNAIVAMLLSRALSAMNFKTACLDLRPEMINAGSRIVKKGTKGWNDFLYSCLYGKNRDILLKPQEHASMDEWNVIQYEGNGMNSYHELDESEMKAFHSAIRDRLNVNYVVCILPEFRSIGSTFLRRYDMTLCAFNDMELKQNASGLKTGHAGIDFRKTITVRYGVVRDFKEKADFNLRFSDRILEKNPEETAETSAWKEVLRIAAYIKDVCDI